MKSQLSIVWFRQDLRLRNNPALSCAIKDSKKIIAIFIVDDHFLKMSTISKCFYHKTLIALADSLAKINIKLNVYCGPSLQIIEEIIALQGVQSIYWNRMYQHDFIKRDSQIKKQLQKRGLQVHSFNASLIVDPYKYTKQLPKLTKIDNFAKLFYQNLPTTVTSNHLTIENSQQFIDLKFSTTEQLKEYSSSFKNCQCHKFWYFSEQEAQALLENFKEKHLAHYAHEGSLNKKIVSSCLSTYIRFGLLSAATIIIDILSDHRITSHQTQEFLKALLLRDYCYFIHYHYPSIMYEPWNKKYKNYPFAINYFPLLEKIKSAQTGISYIDAIIKQQQNMGWLDYNNRLLLGCFMIKILNIPWLVVEDFFAEQYIDYDPAISSINFQAIFGSGPINIPFIDGINTLTICKKLDPQGVYVKKWLPQLVNLNSQEIHSPKDLEKSGYTKIMVDLEQSRSAYLQRINAYQ